MRIRKFKKKPFDSNILFAVSFQPALTTELVLFIMTEMEKTISVSNE